MKFSRDRKLSIAIQFIGSKIKAGTKFGGFFVAVFIFSFKVIFFSHYITAILKRLLNIFKVGRHSLFNLENERMTHMPS